MAPIQYSLHYEDYSEHLMSRFGKLLQMQSLVDMTLMCSSHTLRVHKAVLAASSAYFQEVLQKQSGEPLIMLKMRFSVLKSLVEFMYCGKTQCLEENLDELVAAAQFLKIKGLSKVTKEGLGIMNRSELPIFIPPVVVNRPPQSLIDLHSQDNEYKSQPTQLASVTSANANPPLDCHGRINNKDNMIVRIPFDIDKGGARGSDYADPRTTKPRRGRPSARRSGGWEGASSALGRAAERALLRREHDSRKAIHHLKHLQSRHMQDYMERVTLSEAVKSICGPDSPTSNYLDMSNDLMYMDHTVSSNVLNTIPFSKDQPMGDETSTAYSSAMNTNNVNDPNYGGTNIAMSQYVNALKSAGLPTDLPILFESGDGSYINVNEQVLLDMVQSSEIQYEVIEQPNIIEKVADPSEIKSIDDLSKSIERGEMLMTNKGFSDFLKEPQFRHEDPINNLNSLLPDHMDSFSEQPNFVALDPPLRQDNDGMNQDNNDLSGIDGDMQYFTKSMSDDVKKYYEDPQLHDQSVMEPLCPPSTNLDSNFNISLLDTKIPHLSDNINSLSADHLKNNVDCYDFGIRLSHSAEEDALDCLLSIPKQDESNSLSINNELDKSNKEKEDIIRDLMSIEDKMNMNQNSQINDIGNKSDSEAQVFNVQETFENIRRNSEDGGNMPEDLATMASGSLQWENMDINNVNERDNEDALENNNHNDDERISSSEISNHNSIIDLTEPTKISKDEWQEMDKPDTECNINSKNDDLNVIEDDIPFAVGLQPLKQIQASEETSLKRRSPIDIDLMDNSDSKYLKRKVKHKK